MIVLLILRLFSVNPNDEINHVTNYKDIFQFAKSLELEGDYFRAVSEYKRFLYFITDTTEYDSILYNISKLYRRMERPDLSLATLDKIKIKNTEEYNIKLGASYFLMADYKQARDIWKNNDTLIGWTYLKEKNIGAAKKYLYFSERFDRKNPILGAVLSGLIPGLGRIYAARPGDGVSAFILTAASAYSFFRFYTRKEEIPAIVFGGLTIFFYAGDIYGTTLSVQMYNTKKSNDFIQGIELKMGLLKWLE